MDDRKPEATTTIDELDDNNVPAVTASLEMLSVDTNLPSPVENKRVLRKRIPKLVSREIPNRRCSLKPKKRTFSDIGGEECIKEYYLDKSIKKKPINLETIYEEPVSTSENYICMGTKRYKRMIQFHEQVAASKIRKRRAKIQKVFGSKISIKKKRASVQTLLEKLNSIRSNAPTTIDTELK